MKKNHNCLILLITFIFIFIYLDFLEIPIYLNSNISYFIGNPIIRFISVLLIIYIAENISFLLAIGLVFLYLFLLNNSIRSNQVGTLKIKNLFNITEIREQYLEPCNRAPCEVTNGASLSQTNPIPPPGSSQTPKGPPPLTPNTWVGPLPSRSCKSALAFDFPDMLPPKGSGFLNNPPGPYTDSSIGCSL